MAKNIIEKISFLLLFLAILILPSQVSAQSASPAPVKNVFLEKQKAIQNNTGLESWTNEAMNSNMVSIFVGLNGTVPEEILNDEADFDVTSYIPGGAIGQLNDAIVALHQPPASGIEYIAQVKDNFLGKPAYAQNSVSQKLQFILPLWRIFRNVVYIISTILFVIIGLMIMLRVKVSPQAVITVQSALPRIITSLILVTFSYAIAGLVLDLCNFLQAIVISLLFSAQNKDLTEQLFESTNWYSNWLTDVWEFVKNIFRTDPDYGYSSLVNMDSRTLRDLGARITPNIVTGRYLGLLIGRVTGVGGLLGGLGGVLLPLLISIIKFFWLIKLFFNLLKCYANLLIKIIFAPLEIVLGAIPNSKMNFSSWIIDFAANALVFPVVAIFLVLVNVIIDVFVAGTRGTTQAFWMPNLIDATGLFTFKDRAYTGIATGLGLVALSLLSKLPEMIPVMIKDMKGPDFGKAIGESMGGVMAIPGKTGDAIHRYTGFLDDKERIMPQKQPEPEKTRPKYASAGQSGYSQQKMKPKEPISEAPKTGI